MRRGQQMSTESVIAIIVIILIVLSAANVGLARLAEKRNPPIGKFTECDGVRFHYIDRGDPGAPWAIPILGDIFRYTIAPIVSWPIVPGMLRKLFAPRGVPEEFRENFPISLAVRPNQLRATAEESALLIPAAAGFQSHYSNLRCPVRIFHGTQDRVIEAEQARRLQKALPHSLLHLVEDAGHMVTYADTEAIAQAVAKLNDTTIL
jgi:pimeloyl-ACP methyl ester carboxylesterase